jgi:hypothetical protein
MKDFRANSLEIHVNKQWKLSEKLISQFLIYLLNNLK